MVLTSSSNSYNIPSRDGTFKFENSRESDPLIVKIDK